MRMGRGENYVRFMVSATACGISWLSRKLYRGFLRWVEMHCLWLRCALVRHSNAVRNVELRQVFELGLE